MLFKTALRIIVHEKEKFGGAVAGVARAIFLMLVSGLRSITPSSALCRWCYSAPEGCLGYFTGNLSG